MSAISLETSEQMKTLIAKAGLPIVSLLVLSLTAAISLRADDREKEGAAPDVITTLTDEQTQERDQQRPEYLQPTKAEDTASAPPIDPRQGETIVFLGNSLAERMEHHHFFEASLQQTFADREITFRNMGFPGHTPGFRPEAGRKTQWAFPGAEEFHPELKTHLGQGHYPSPDEWLTIVQASTIVAFFGFNESFGGMQGVDNFRNELRAFVDHTLSQSYTRDGKAPRLVLATPIAMEQHPDFFLPDAEERNQIIKAYVRAVAEVAAEKKVGLIDLYTPSEHWFRESSAPLTVNGVHLSEDGYRRLAPILMHGLFGQVGLKVEESSLLHQAIADKAWFWRNDYRMLNGVHAYGRRWAPYGNFNYPEEIEKIRQMTVLRDRNIHAIAQGKSTTLKVDDSVTRPLSPVTTNYQVSEKNGTTDFLTTEKEVYEKFTLPEGYEVSLFASEQQFPNLGNPCQMRFDNRGRLWVSTLPSYPHYKPGDPKPNDMLLVYEDIDGDGRADKETVFAQGLHMPIGFEIAPEGVYLSQEPFLLLLKDTDGDNQADQTEYLLDGFDPHDTHHAISAFDMDHGSGLYMCEGRFLHSQVETPWGPQRMTDGGVWRFDPASWKVERVMQSDVSNPWGVAHDEFGQTYVNDASGGSHYWMLGLSMKIPHGREVPKVSKFNYEHHARPTSGSEFIHSRHFPDEVQGDYIYANSIGFLGIKQLQTVEDGSELKGKFRQNLIQSSDGNFRPCDLQIAPDGSLYFVDWHNTLIGHMQHSARDPLRNSEYGRIYRITYPSRPLVEAPEIADASLDVLFENMKLPELNARKWSHRELRGRRKSDVIEAAHQFADRNSTDERLVLEALWATWGQQDPSIDLIQRCLSAKDHRVRAAAIRVVRHSLHIIDAPEAFLQQAATDAHSRVRLEALSAATWLGGRPGAEILLMVATQKTDNWIRNALNSSMLLLQPDVEALLEQQQSTMDSLTVDAEKFLGMQLEGAAKRKNYKSKSPKFKDRDFSRAYALGEKVFYEEGSCYTCHRDHGEGVTRMYPPLVGSEWITGDQDRLIKLTLHGIWGSIRVRGEIFEPASGVPPMTAVGNFFSDAEVAGVLTYVRNSWGNDASIILPEDVKRVRQQTKDRQRFYSPEELTNQHPFPEGSRTDLIADTIDTKLQESLEAEGPTELAAAALREGNARRGAKLFYDRKTACASCHDAQETFQIGPELTEARKEVTPEFIVQSILKPSASIRKGFQSVTIVTDEGQALSGFLVQETDEAIIISVAAEKGRHRTLSKESVDDLVRAQVSTMPAGLSGFCGDRQGFLDLVRFVIEINRDGPNRLKKLKKRVKVE